jgi:hypothetical protein
MSRAQLSFFLTGLTLAFSILGVLAFATNSDGLMSGKAELQSAGALAFGPSGVLFVGDSVQASIFAIDTEETKQASSSASVDVKGLNNQIAALAGTSAEQIRINDVKVNPVSHNIYVSASRGLGPDATPLLVRVGTNGKIELLQLDRVRFAKVALPNAPEAKAGQSNPRMDTITQIAYVKGNLLVAGLSNEEFSSNLRTIPFPFPKAEANGNRGASVEIFHGSHKRYETNSPIRTFVPFTIGSQEYIVAAYTCTPLVKIPVSELKPGNHVKGSTIAELGFGNRPLDMLTYSKDGHDFLLMANNRRGVMKLSMEHLDKYESITTPVEETTGLPYQTLKELTGVQHLTGFDGSNALILTSVDKSLELKTIPLP